MALVTNTCHPRLGDVFVDDDKSIQVAWAWLGLGQSAGPRPGPSGVSRVQGRDSRLQSPAPAPRRLGGGGEAGRRGALLIHNDLFDDLIIWAFASHAMETTGAASMARYQWEGFGQKQFNPFIRWK